MSKICPILLNMSKKLPKDSQNFLHFSEEAESMSKLAKYAQNMSIMCPNFRHSLDTFSIIIGS